MPDNISKLYNELQNTYELGTEDEFRTYLSDPRHREALRKELEADYDVGDSGAFDEYLGFGATVPAAKPQGTQPGTQPGGGGTTTNDAGGREPKYGNRVSTYDDSPFVDIKEPKQVEWQTKEGETVRVDTVRPSSTGKGAAIVEVEKPRTQVAGDASDASKERESWMSKESMDDFYSYEPNANG